MTKPDEFKEQPTLSNCEQELLDVRELLQAYWVQLDGDAYLLPDGTVEPGAVTTLHDLAAYLGKGKKT